MSGLWNRFKRFVTGNAHAALDNVENVETTSKQIVREIDEKVKNAENSLNKAEARMMLVQDDCSRAKKEVEKWNGDAVRANNAGKRDLAMQCVQRAKEAQRQVDVFAAELVALEESIASLRDQIDEAYRDRNAVATDITIMQTQMHVANAAAEAAEAVASVNTNDQLSEIGNLRRRVQEKSAEAKAKINTNERRSGKDLDKQLRDLDSQTDDDYLNSLLATPTAASAVSQPTVCIASEPIVHKHNHNHVHHYSDSGHHSSPSYSASDSSSSSCSGSDSGSCGGGGGGCD